MISKNDRTYLLNEILKSLNDYDIKRAHISVGAGGVGILTKKELPESLKNKITLRLSFGQVFKCGKLPWWKNIFKKITTSYFSIQPPNHYNCRCSLPVLNESSDE